MSNWEVKPCPSCLNYLLNVYTSCEPYPVVIIVCDNCGKARVAALATEFKELE